MNKFLIAAATALLFAGAAHATDEVVNAKTDSVSYKTGTGLVTGIDLYAGETFNITSSVNDLWDAGGTQEWSTAAGLSSTVVATTTDDSGITAGTVIGKKASFGAFYIGELVGQIGNGAYFAIGTDYSGVAKTTGVLKLFEWDSYAYDNSGTITADVTAVPEPASVALMLAGVGMIAGLARRRSKNLG